MQHRRSPPTSFRLDMGGADHLGPFLGFIGEELAELGRRERKRRAVAGLEARHKFAHGRDIRQRRRARRGRDRERTQLPAPHMLDRSRDPGKRDHDLSAEKIGQSGPRAAIRLERSGKTTAATMA